METTPSTTLIGLVNKTFLQRKQGQLSAQSALEKILSECLCEAKQAATRMRTRTQATHSQETRNG